MERYGYTLKKNSGEPKRSGRFRKEELELMTTFQLREICRREKIIQGVLDPMDKEELVRVILRYRGAEEYFLIQTEEEEGLKAVSRVFRTVRMQERQGSGLEGGSKIVVYEGIATGPFDGLTLPYNKDLAGTNAFVVGGDRTVCGIFHLVPKGGDMDCLYLTRAAGLSCRESGVKHYSLYCMGRRESERMYELYQGKTDVMPEHYKPKFHHVYTIPSFHIMLNFFYFTSSIYTIKSRLRQGVRGDGRGSKPVWETLLITGGEPLYNYLFSN